MAKPANFLVRMGTPASELVQSAAKKSGLDLGKHTAQPLTEEAMQRAQQAVTTSTVGATSNVTTAAESLKRLQTRQAERQARLDAAAQLEKVADGRELEEKLAQAGVGTTGTSSAQAVLERLKLTQAP